MNKIGWELEKRYKESIYDGITINEYTDLKKVKGYIKLNKEEEERSEYMRGKYKDDKEQMKSYMTRYKEGIFKIRTYLPKHKWGRIQYEGHTSLSIFRRSIRHSYSKGKYIDIDIVNSGPSIINEICKENNYRCENLERYVENREEIMEEVKEYYGVTKECVKSLYIRLMMGGSYIKWIKDNNIDVMNKEEHDNIKLISNELNGIREIVYLKNDKIRGIKLEKWTDIENEKRGVFALWYQTIERAIQETIIKNIVIKRGIKLEDIIPCQDGFMILEEEWYDNLIEDSEREVKDMYGIEIKLKRKEFDEAYEIADYEGEMIYNFNFLKTTTDFLEYIYECEEYKGKLYKEDEKIYYKYNDITRIFDMVRAQEVRQDISKYVLKMIRENKSLIEEKDYNKYEMKYGNEMTRILKDYNINKESYKTFNRLKYFLPIKGNKVIYIGEEDCKIGENEVILESDSRYNTIKGKIYKKNEIVERTAEYKFNYISEVEYIEELSKGEEEYCNKYFSDIFCNNEETKRCVINILKTVIAGVLVKHIFCCLGEKGNNGKSAFFDILLKGIMGRSMDVLNKSLIIEQGSNSAINTECEKLDKIRVGYVNEFDENDIFNNKMIKMITGGDGFHLRTLHEKEVTIKATCNLFINTNLLPQSKNKTDGPLYERAVIIPFNNVFAKNSKFLIELRNNIDILFSYIVKYGKIQEDNVEISEEMQVCKDKYKEDNKKDSFLGDYMEEMIEKEEGERIERDVIYEGYYNWCSEKNIKQNKIPYVSFSKLLKKYYGINNIRTNNIVYYVDIKMKHII